MCVCGNVEAALVDRSSDVRRTALEALGALAFQGDAGSVLAAQSCLRDPDARVQCAAVKTLSLLVQRGDHAAADVARQFLSHKLSSLRIVAMEALVEILKEGDCSFIVAASVVLQKARGSYSDLCVLLQSWP